MTGLLGRCAGGGWGIVRAAISERDKSRWVEHVKDRSSMFGEARLRCALVPRRKHRYQAGAVRKESRANDAGAIKASHTMMTLRSGTGDKSASGGWPLGGTTPTRVAERRKRIVDKR